LSKAQLIFHHPLHQDTKETASAGNSKYVVPKEKALLIIKSGKNAHYLDANGKYGSFKMLLPATEM